KTVVAGLPKMMDGTIGVQAQKVIDFVNIMKSMINIPISFQDERLTTVEVEKRMIEANVRRNKRRETADRLAAQLILQGYLDRNRSYGFLRLMSGFWLLLFCILFFVAAVYIHREVTTPASSAGIPRVIYIPKGSNLKTVSSILKNEGIISNSTIFNLLVRYKLVEGGLRAGEYELSPDMTPLQVLDKILSGKVYQYPVTIPEGYNIFEIASLLHQKELADRGKIILLSFNKEFVKSLGIESDNLEGYIFPDTYYINRGMDEKETGKESEKPLISAVFYNRFKKGMKLQCDPTVIYALLLKGLKEKSYLYDGDIKKEDLLIDSPYNTYKYAGLPPAPIANPGKSSIHAAVYPSKSNYLYFVSRQDGWH
ncbi:MAG: endolytic transglycosylase MltG, partial [Nitrospinota bacterium]